jgi:hypothetical protein
MYLTRKALLLGSRSESFGRFCASAAQVQGRGAGQQGARCAPRHRALASRDDAPASLDEVQPSGREAELLRAVQQVEIQEPEVEQRGEGAALAVAAAVAFGAGIWAVLGKAKGEGEGGAALRKPCTRARPRGVCVCLSPAARPAHAAHATARPAEYFAGYLLEQSLSVDNLFVFILVFKYFKTPVAYQNKVLGYGIGTAAVLRLVLILVGVDFVASWKPVLLFFAGILLFSSFKLLT